MYTHVPRMKAVKLCIQYDHQLSLVVREFGYPKSTCTLAKWCEEFGHSGELPVKYQRQPKYTQEERSSAVRYYLEHGKNYHRTCVKPGYPSRTILKERVMEDAPDEAAARCKTDFPLVNLNHRQQRDQMRKC